MTNVTKYNICKGVSTALVLGTPIITMFCCGDFFVGDPGKSVSSLGVLTLLFVLLFTKDKIAEHWKTPSAMVIAAIVFILCSMVKNIIVPIQIVSGLTLCAASLDEITTKSLYKRYELLLPENAKAHKVFGFIVVSLEKLLEEEKELKNESTD